MNLAEGNQLIEQKLYRPLQVTIVDLDRPGREGPATRPDLPLQSVGEDRIAAYTAEIMDAIRKLQPQEEARSLFAQYTGALEKISKNLMSLRLTVEHDHTENGIQYYIAVTAGIGIQLISTEPVVFKASSRHCEASKTERPSSGIQVGNQLCFQNVRIIDGRRTPKHRGCHQMVVIKGDGGFPGK